MEPYLDIGGLPYLPISAQNTHVLVHESQGYMQIIVERNRHERKDAWSITHVKTKKTKLFVQVQVSALGFQMPVSAYYSINQ